MSVSIVIGGQFGSEGKGKVARFFASKIGASTVVRVGGTNSGHTVINSNGEPVIFRILPTAAIDRNAVCVLPAGSYLDVGILFEEIARSGIDPSMVKIHPNAAVITDEQVKREQTYALSTRIGSTCSGTGAAVGMRVMRETGFLQAKDVEILKPFICDTVDYLRAEIRNGKEVLIEGTQGYGLSNLHSEYYPYATSRDTSAAGFLSETGLSPFDVKTIVMVIRAFPIRVAGNSGELPNEITWDKVTELAKSQSPIVEYTSVTKRVRRVGRFDAGIVNKTIIANQPNQIVLNHLDYIADDTVGIGHERQDFINDVQRSINSPIDYIGLGPDVIF